MFPERDQVFEDHQIKALLDAPGREKRSERRNRVLLVLGYDAAMRVGELTGVKVHDLHLNAETPYIRILGKGEKYRSVPLMKKTVQHLRDISGNFMGISLNRTRLSFIRPHMGEAWAVR